MNKTLAVFKREYIQAVRKKMFIIMTFLMPFLMVLLMAIPTMLIRRGLGEKVVAVLDGTGALRDAFAESSQPSRLQEQIETATRQRGGVRMEYVDAGGDTLQAKTDEYLSALRSEEKEERTRYSAVAVIPADVMDNPDATLMMYSRSSADVMAQERVRGTLRRALQRQRLTSAGVDPGEIDKIFADVRIDAVQLTRSGEEKRGGEMNLIIAFVFGALLILPVFIHGTEVMRGIIQEKTDRVVELLISSMSPEELLRGKILGLAAVGLTQTGVWMIMGGLAAGYSALTASMAGYSVVDFLRPAIFAYFLMFFLLGFLLLVCVYAIGGSACNSEKDAQQLMAPLVMVMLVPWFLMMPILTSPDSTFAVTLSMIPIFTPMTMFARILVSEPPFWQVALSVLLTVATIWGLMNVTAKVFRVGILSYGKRPTIPELWRWAKVA